MSRHREPSFIRLGFYLILLGGIIVGVYSCEKRKVKQLSAETGLDLYSISDVVPVRSHLGDFLYVECEGVGENENNQKFFVEYKISNYHYEKFINLEEYSFKTFSEKKIDQFVDIIIPEYEPTRILNEKEIVERLDEIQNPSSTSSNKEDLEK